MLTNLAQKICRVTAGKIIKIVHTGHTSHLTTSTNQRESPNHRITESPRIIANQRISESQRNVRHTIFDRRSSLIGHRSMRITSQFSRIIYRESPNRSSRIMRITPSENWYATTIYTRPIVWYRLRISENLAILQGYDYCATTSCMV